MRYPLTLITLGMLLILAGCIQTSSEPEIVATRLVEAPRPPESFDLQTGAATYVQWCVQCHGEQGRGDGPTASAFTCELPNFPERPATITIADWYNIIRNGNGSSDTACLMPPWSQRLNDQQMWDVAAYVASLVYDPSLVSTGQSLLAAKTAGTSPFNFDNMRWQVDTSDAAILTSLENNEIAGYDFTGLSDEEKQALLVYVRSLSYEAFPVEVAAVQTPAPVTTEEPIDEQPLAITPIPLGTEEPAPETGSTFTLTGKVVNGTAGATLPADLTVLLRVVALNSQDQPEEVYRAEMTVGADGSFSFADVPRAERALASLETDYAGIRQFAPQFAPASVQEDTFELEFPVYETTTDTGVLTISYMEMLIDAVTAENASLTFHTFEISNTSDKVFVGNEDGRTLELHLPTGVIGAEVEAMGNFEGRFEIQENGDETIVYDTSPLFPGTARIGVSYGKEYNGEMELTQRLLYPVQEASIFVSEVRGLEVESDRLVRGQDVNFNNLIYTGYTLKDGGLPANSTLTFRVYDGPNAGRSTASTSEDGEEEKSFLQENVALILGLGVLLIVAGGMFMVYDLQKTRLLAQQTGTKSTPKSRRDLVAQIAELDAAYEAGEIDEKTYTAEREALKAALRRQLE